MPSCIIHSPCPNSSSIRHAPIVVQRCCVRVQGLPRQLLPVAVRSGIMHGCDVQAWVRVQRNGLHAYFSGECFRVATTGSFRDVCGFTMVMFPFSRFLANHDTHCVMLPSPSIQYRCAHTYTSTPTSSLASRSSILTAVACTDCTRENTAWLMMMATRTHYY